MKPLLLALLSFTLVSLHAEDSREAALKTADDARVAAFTKADAAGLTAILSDDLRYAHSSGAVDTKASLTNAITSGGTKYATYEYEDRSFTFPAPGIALMSGRAHVKAVTPKGEMDGVLGFLAVWKEENGHWHFLAWQSCKLPPAAPAVK